MEQQEKKMKEPKLFNKRWILKKKVSSGTFGIVFIGQDKETNEFGAIKLEKQEVEELRSLDREVYILQKLSGCTRVPELKWSGKEHGYNIMIIELLGRDLAYFMKQLKKFSLQTVLKLLDQLIPAIQEIHEKGVLHRDLKPENICMGRGKDQDIVKLIDFGISKIYKDGKGRHIVQKSGKQFLGTTRYASISAHLGNELSRKDDLESLGYLIIFLIKGKLNDCYSQGSLPWQNLKDVSEDQRSKVVGEIKQNIQPSELCKDLPSQFVQYFEYVQKLSFKSEPNYIFIRELFQILGKQMNLDYFWPDWDWADKKSLKVYNSLNINSPVCLKNPSNLSAFSDVQNDYIKQPDYKGQSNLMVPDKDQLAKRRNSLFDNVSNFSKTTIKNNSLITQRNSQLKYSFLNFQEEIKEENENQENLSVESECNDSMEEIYQLQPNQTTNGDFSVNMCEWYKFRRLKMQIHDLNKSGIKHKSRHF